MTVFVETTEFSKRRIRFLPGDRYGDLQKELIANPRKGAVMPGCGGLRKIRIVDPKRQKGKRGGGRVIYLHIPEVDQFLMLDIYGKGEKEDLGAADKKLFRKLARDYKTAIIDAARDAKKEEEP
jgi:hypothetical protein